MESFKVRTVGVEIPAKNEIPAKSMQGRRNDSVGVE
jgi:hypothetical protein